MSSNPPRRLLVHSICTDAALDALVADLGIETLRCASLADLQDRAGPDDVAISVRPSAEALELLAGGAVAGLTVLVAVDAARITEAPVVEGLEVLVLPAGAEELKARITRAADGARARNARRAQAEERVQRARFRTLRDQLTGLPNARLFRERLERAMLRARRDQEPITVAVLRVGREEDRDREMGRGGPELLRRIAERLRSALRATDTVAIGQRQGTVSRGAAPEFFVLLPAGRGQADPQRGAERLLALALGEAPSDGEPSLVPELAVGYAVAPEDAEEPDQLIAAARAALHRARAGECRRADHETPVAEPASFEAFELWYQPIFDLPAEDIVGVEALLRWPHPSLGLLGAQELLGAARKAGVAGRLYEAILDGVCRQWRRWADSPVGAVEIGLNIDGPEWRSPKLPERLADALARHGVDPEFLRLEIDEAELAGASPLAALSELGVRLCVHDFGAGPTALSTLRVLAGERIKLARSVVADTPDDALAMRDAGAIAAMCRSADVEAVALGVESDRQQRALEGLGYELMQGVGLRAPAAPEHCESLLRARLRRRSHATVLPFRRVAGV